MLSRHGLRHFSGTLLSFAAAVVACSTGACSTAVDVNAPNVAPRAEEPLQTDSLAYTAVLRSGTGTYRTYGFRVVTHFTNRSAAPVYLANCTAESTSPIYSVLLVGDTTGTGGWGSVFNHAWACVGSDRPFEVPPGATRTDTLNLLGPGAFDGVTGQPIGTFDGRLRLGYEVQTCRGDGACGLPLDAGISNTFDVRVAR